MNLMSSIYSIIQQNPFTLFALTLLLGLIGGDIARRIPFIPKISGYMLIGFVIGPHVLDLVEPTLLSQSALFIDTCLGLIMFELGRHLDISWLRHDKGLFFMALFEPFCTFSATFILLILLKFSFLSASVIAVLSIATSPAVVMMVANDLSAEGAVTRRTLLLTSSNNFICLLLFIFILPMTEHFLHLQSMTITHSFYQIFGSALLGGLIFILAKIAICLLGKHRESQFVLYVSTVILTISLANTYALSASLSLLVYGFAARNLDRQQSLMEIDFGWFGRMFFIILFVITGVTLQLSSLKMLALTIFGILCARLVSKCIAIAMFAKISNLSKIQSLSTSLALYPMGGIAIGMASVLGISNRELGADIFPVISCLVAVLNILGPIATQFAFIQAKEALIDGPRLRDGL